MQIPVPFQPVARSRGTTKADRQHVGLRAVKHGCRCITRTRKTSQLLHLCFLGLLIMAPGCSRRDEQAQPTKGNSAEKHARSPDAQATPAETMKPDTVANLRTQREELNRSVYAPEIEAQRHEQVFVQLWDALRNSDPWGVLKGFTFDELHRGLAEPLTPVHLGSRLLKRWRIGSSHFSSDHATYVKQLAKLADEGWQIDQSEWHHEQFVPGDPPQSLVKFEIHAQLPKQQRRAIVRGKLHVTWKGRKENSGLPEIATIKTADMEVVEQTGQPMFAEVALLDPKKIAPRRHARVNPLLLHDFNGDGLSEIVMAGCNVMFWNRGNGQFDQDDFLLADAPAKPLKCGIVADFTGDGLDDYIGGSLDDLRLLLYAGSEDGRFRKTPSVCFNEMLKNPAVLTAGDIDGDGDLDLFVGQWRAPYEKGSMPRPYYDANDAPPDYLLENDGQGNFKDVTAQSGLAVKRHRRTYTASLIDLDDDGNQDLMVVADFAGLDLYRNDGRGGFTDCTSEWVDQHNAFGMSHTVADYNNDGRLDLYMIGMSSTTARRLEQLGIRHPGYEEQEKKRMAMAYGNRMYLRKGTRYIAPPFADQVARTGWSWGCASNDFDNDGDVDIYVANGHISGKSSQDYCTHFWSHDLYSGDSQPNETLNSFFNQTLLKGLGREFSWNGYEHNALLMNQDGRAFVNSGYLCGVAFEFDSRSVVADDLNRDGKVDLLVIEYFTEEFRERLHIIRNIAELSGHWIGVDLRTTDGSSPIGARVAIEAGGRQFVGRHITGDSFSAQHCSTLHFGLGNIASVEAIEVHWSNGKKRRIARPPINQYLHVEPPK